MWLWLSFLLCGLRLDEIDLSVRDAERFVFADNLNGAIVVGRTIRVDHVANYKKKVEEDEEEEQRKREERGVCYAFQRGECNRGASCKFSHDEQVFHYSYDNFKLF